MSSGVFGREYRDPYADLVLSQLLSVKDALTLSRPEYELLLASVRSYILTSPDIRKILQRQVKEMIAELQAARDIFANGG
jgi:hypothetical protein